jgi:pimeloyl-ACP methyl ester carboxylesterase
MSMLEAGNQNQDLSVPTTDGVRLHVRHRPGTRSPAFLLVHGVASSARMWDEVAERLAAEHYPTYAVDLRGHGESDTPDQGYDTATASSDVATLAAALGLTGAVVAGHSWGASISLRLAAEHPTLVGGLALIDGGWTNAGPAEADWTGDESMRLRLTRWLDAQSERFARPGGATATEMRAHLREVHPKWSKSAIDAHLASMRTGPDGALVPPLPGRHFASIAESVWSERPHRWYRAVTVPVMLLPVAHRYSPLGERQWQEWVDGAEAALPRATVRWYLDADHELPYEHPERLANDLLDLAHKVGR